MKRVALVTAGNADAGVASGRLRALLPALEEAALDVQLFLAPGLTGESAGAAEFAARPGRTADTLVPRDFDSILYFLGNDPAHAFMLPLSQHLGGTVVLHDWELGRLAAAARPELARTGLAGQFAAWREGGLRSLLAHRRRGPASALVEFPFNRSVVRHADAFVVPRSDWRRRILDERNAPTPIAVIPWDEDQDRDEIAATAPRFCECLELFPTHRANRKSLIKTAIDQADRARAERE
jgi:hypothetical protein